MEQSSPHTPASEAIPKARRRHAPPISRAQSVYEWTALLLLGMPALAGVWLFGSVRPWSFGSLIVLSLAGVLLVLIGPVFFRSPDVLFVPPGVIPCFLFLVYAAWSIRIAAVPYDAWIEVLRIASYVGAYWAWTTLAGRNRRWRYLVGLLLVSGTLMAWYALVQHGQESRMVLNLQRPEVYGMRASGAYFCPNHFANLLEMLLPLGLALACCPSAGMPLRLLGGYSIAVILPPLYLSESRSGWIGAFAGLTVTVCLLSLRKSTRRFLATLVIAPLAAGAVAWLAWRLSPMVQERVADALRGNIRIQLWRDTLLMIRDNPWWGHGPGSFRWVYPHFRRHMTAYLDPQFAHNDYLHTLAEYGVIGLSLCIATALAAVARLVAAVRRTEREKDACLVAGFLGALAATCCHAFFDYNLQIFGNVHVLIMMAGIVTAGLFADGVFKPVALRPLILRTGQLCAAVATALLISGAVMVVASYAFNRRADTERAGMKFDAAQADYARSIRIDGRNWNPYLGMAHLFRIESFWNLDAESKAAEAKEADRYYHESLRRNSWETDALYGMSKLYASMGDQQKSLDVLVDLVKRIPYQRDYLSELGLRLREMGRYEEAMKYFEQARQVEDTEMIEINIRWLQEKMKEKPET